MTYRKPPSSVAQQGYTKLSFMDDFNSPATIDLGNTQAPGFNWYLANWFTQGRQATPAGNIKVAGSVLSISGNQIVTAFDTNAVDFTGTVFGGGGYFEAALAFDHTNTLNPFFYGMSIEHIYDTTGAGDAHWPGQPPNYCHFIEVDIFEPLSDPTTYQNTVHDWSGIETNNQVPTNIVNGATLYHSVGNVDWTQFHRYGCLWVPQNGATPGSLSFYFDGVKGSSVYYAGPPGSPPLPQQPAGNYDAPTAALAEATYSIIDQHRLALTVGLNSGVPLRCDYVAVWTK